MNSRNCLIVLAISSLALAGCQRNAAQTARESETQVFTAPETLPEFSLQPMGVDDLGDYDVEGDKSCRFAEHPAGLPLVQANGFAHRPGSQVQAFVKYGEEMAQATSVTPAGGLDALHDQATFDTGGVVVDVQRITTEPDGSGPARPNRAMLRLRMAGQEEQLLAGFWICTI